jgi:hypothetical protein
MVEVPKKKITPEGLGHERAEECYIPQPEHPSVCRMGNHPYNTLLKKNQSGFC